MSTAIRESISGDAGRNMVCAVSRVRGPRRPLRTLFHFRLDEFEKFDVSSFASDKVRYLSFDSRGPVLADEL